MSRIAIRNATIVNEGKEEQADLLIEQGRIARIGDIGDQQVDKEVEAMGLYLLPGLIDDQVHFREPGLTHKADIFTESRAAVAGGITSYMEMPNTVPQAVTQAKLSDKYATAKKKSLANYSFFMGATNDNLEEVLKTDAKNVCGVKVFMGSSTGNMLVDDDKTLEGIFSEVPMLIATHCEDEATVRRNLAEAKAMYGEDIPMRLHPEIRSVEACYLSSSKAVALARQHGARLHVLHISTAKEIELFDYNPTLEEKKITAEACIHHLWFNEEQYESHGSHIKWNPAVKSLSDREAIRAAVSEDLIDVIATDHAPHTLEEKANGYLNAPSGGPLVQHALPALLQLVDEGVFTLARVVEKTSHNVARLFQIGDRGFIREGYWADIVLVDRQRPWTVEKENLLYKCGWSPFEGHRFNSQVTHTFVNGHLAYEKGKLNDSQLGARLVFERE